MRDIKFRAWDKERKMMIGSDYPKNWGNELDEFWADAPCLELSLIEIINKDKRFSVMQYTGLKDKNGKEIYEGDIIEHWGERYIVPDFTPLDRSYQAENIKEHHDGSDDWMSMSDVDWEVIGNIYENPELLPTLTQESEV